MNPYESPQEEFGVEPLNSNFPGWFLAYVGIFVAGVRLVPFALWTFLAWLGLTLNQ